MATTIAMMIGGAVTNALAFSGSNYLFGQMGSGERKRHDLAIEKLQHERDKFNQERLERIDYINQRLMAQGHASRTFKSVNDALQQYYLLTGDEQFDSNLQPMRPEPQLSDFYTPEKVFGTEQSQISELLIITVGLGVTGYLVYKFL